MFEYEYEVRFVFAHGVNVTVQVNIERDSLAQDDVVNAEVIAKAYDVVDSLVSLDMSWDMSDLQETVVSVVGVFGGLPEEAI